MAGLWFRIEEKNLKRRKITKQDVFSTPRRPLLVATGRPILVSIQNEFPKSINFMYLE